MTKGSLFNNRTSIDWLKLDTYLLKYNYEVIPAQKDGHCFISAIRLCLEQDHGLIFTEADIKKLITYEVFQNNNYYIQFYDGTVLSMLRSLDRYIVVGVYTQQVVDIAILAAANILRVNMCIYKNENGVANLYAQPANSNPPSTRDVYLAYSNEHYDSIVSMTSTCHGGTFNISQEDVEAFAQIGAYFHITNPIDAVNGGKLYFVPRKNFCDPNYAPLPCNIVQNPTDSNEDNIPQQFLSHSTIGPSVTSNKTVQPSTSIYPDEGSIFVPDAATLENGVQDFNTDVRMQGQDEEEIVEEEGEGKRNKEDEEEEESEESEEEKEGEYDSEEEVYDMFAGLDLAERVPEKFHFEEAYSHDEDAVLDNAEAELENVTPLKPRKEGKNNSQNPKTKKSKARKKLTHDITTDKADIHIDITGIETNKSSRNTEPIIDLTASAPPTPQDFYDSEQLNSDSASFLSDSSSSTSRNKPRKYEKVGLDERRMAHAPVHIVDEIPWGPNGDNIYKMKCTEDNWINKYEDGRWFYLRNSTHDGLLGKRRIGKCLGSFICKRGDCPKLTTEDIVNTIDFRRVSKNFYVCACCGYKAEREYCGCIKAVEIDNTTQTLTYWHQGTHICQLKPNVRERRKALDSLPIPINGYTKPTKYMKECMRHYIDREDYDAAFDVSKAVCQDDVIAQIKKMRKHPNRQLNRTDELESFANVKEIQASLLKSDKDKYLVYKSECRRMGGQASYVFKTSAVSLKIAAMMSGKIKVGGQDSSLRTEPAYFDGMHTRVKFFVSLTLWVFHNAMRMMILLAVMDTPREHSDDIEIFFNTFNEALGDFLNEPEYIWDPFLIMMDHKGANFEALERVYGEDFRRYRTVTCQWHFLHCAEKYLSKCSESERKSFRQWCMELCLAHTRKEYKRLARLIKGVAKKYNFLPWWKWWAPRCPHVVPAIRGFNLPRMNQAEIGQSKMKPQKRLWLTEAVKVDMIDFTFQKDRYNKFVRNEEKICGRGPTLKKRSERERAEERRFVEQFCDVIENGDLLEERDNPDDMGFMPSGRAKHKAPLYDIGIQEKPTRKKKGSKGGKKLPDRLGRGFNPKFASDDEEEMSVAPKINKKKGKKESDKKKYPVEDVTTSEDEVFFQTPQPNCKTKRNTKDAIHRQTNLGYEVFPPTAVPRPKNKGKSKNPKKPANGDDGTVPQEIEAQFVKANRVHYVVLTEGYQKSKKMVTYCRGCKGPIRIEDKKFPYNMVFRYKYYRKVPEDNTLQKWVMSKEKLNCYFHARDMGCLHQIAEIENVEIPDVYMDNASFKRLKPENIHILERKHHWDAIVENREKLVRDGHL